MNEPTFWQSMITSVLVSVIAENFVFARAFGVSTMIVSAKNNRNLHGMCMGVIYFTTAAAAVTWAVTSSFPVFTARAELKPLIYAMIIGCLYVITLLAAFIFIKKRFSRSKKYVHIAAFNGAVMGTIFLCSSNCTGLLEHIVFGLCAGIGFTAASHMLSGVYSHLYSENVPSAFRGYPAVMLFIGIISMAVYGVLGHTPLFA